MSKMRNLYPRIYVALGHRQYYSFSYQALYLIINEEYTKWNFNPFNYYEFGTGEGNSLMELLRALQSFLKALI
jgi:hypothetical protein